MGNATSNQNSVKQLETDIRAIAGSLITNNFNTSFKDLKDSTDPATCDKLTVLTAKLLNKYATKKEVKYLVQQQKDKQLAPTFTKEDIYIMKPPFNSKEMPFSSIISDKMKRGEKQKLSRRAQENEKVNLVKQEKKTKGERNTIIFFSGPLPTWRR